MSIELHGSVWLTVGGENLGGEGRIALLAKIAECGSITKAAKAIKMSYKAAWDAIDKMNNLAGEPLVERVSGGKGGGGTRLTKRGTQLVSNFSIIEREHRQFVNTLSQQAENMAQDFMLVRRMALKTSARNQFLGTVTHLTHGAVNDEIELELAGGQKIVAIVTHDSTIDLGLAPGSEAFALVKASSIILVTGNEDVKFSARNRMRGIVTRLTPGAVNSEVVIDVDGGGTIAAVITNHSCESLELVLGCEATALFKASSVILGVPV
jgi:molybdate transport system regulatory protein